MSALPPKADIVMRPSGPHGHSFDLHVRRLNDLAAAGLMHRQVLREEHYLKGHYGEA